MSYEAYEALMDRVRSGEDMGPRYSGDEGATYIKWPDAFLDFMDLAHPHRQAAPWEAFMAAQEVIDKYEDGFRTRDEFQEFLDCFDDPRKNEKRSRYVPAQNRRRVLGRGKCEHCGSTEDLVVDHRRPFSRGGTHHISNLQCLCWTCNASKGARTMGNGCHE